MPAMATGYVKNSIRRCFSELVDHSPTKADRIAIWEHFDSVCAYCGRPLNRTAKQAHIDHLIPASQGGTNAIGNRVLSCANCNEEKRDQRWDAFLRQKSDSDTVFVVRREKIHKWQRLHSVPDDAGLLSLREEATAKATQVIELFDQKIKELRRLVDQKRHVHGP